MANDPNYNWIYKALVKDSNDVHGAVAYVLYKNEKIAYIEDFGNQRNILCIVNKIYADSFHSFPLMNRKI